MKILDDGKFPDWNSLILGGEDGTGKQLNPSGWEYVRYGKTGCFESRSQHRGRAQCVSNPNLSPAGALSVNAAET